MERMNWMQFFEKYLSRMGWQALGQIVMAVHFAPKYRVEMCQAPVEEMDSATFLLYEMICDYIEGKWPPVLEEHRPVERRWKSQTTEVER